jgi:hypothetical protein
MPGWETGVTEVIVGLVWYRPIAVRLWIREDEMIWIA